jgi:hypothetical protein
MAALQAQNVTTREEAKFGFSEIRESVFIAA